MSVGRLIEGPDCLREGARWLAAREPRFEAAYVRTGPLPLRLRKDGFTALLDAIVSQQISVAAANAIWGRMKAAGVTSARGLQRADDDCLRVCGLSAQKIRYARALAGSGIRYRRLREMPTDAVIDTLTAVTGIGPWTAEIYAMFSLGRADVFAPGDLALQEAARMLFDLPERPTAAQIRAMAQDWSPWRAVAARLLWAYYRLEKEREGIK